MIIGVPRERKTLERRVAITPDGARQLVTQGHKIVIEASAGLGSGFTDSAYQAAGCTVLSSHEEVWKKAELLVKVKEPHESEYPFLRDDLTIFTYLHLASMPELADRLLASGATSIGYELVQLPNGKLPLLEPMSEIAGKLSVLNGSYYLLSQHGGSGVLVGGAVGVAPAKIVIVGAGTSGVAACISAVGLGADVTILDISPEKLEWISHRFGSNVRALYSNPSSIERACKDADLLIGAVLVPGGSTPRLISKGMIALMRPGSVFVDISIDQGGCAETIRPTSLDAPTYVESGIIHYGVCNMPSQTARTSTLALTARTLRYISLIGKLGVHQAVLTVPELRTAMNTHAGRITNDAVGEALGKEAVAPSAALADANG